MPLHAAMAVPRLSRSLPYLINNSCRSAIHTKPTILPRSLPTITTRRRYATPSGVKDVAVRDALNEALAEELEANSKTFVIGEEVAQYNGAYKVTKGLLDRFGEKRVIDSPITEAGFTGLAVGAALAGLHPIV